MLEIIKLLGLAIIASGWIITLLNLQKGERKIHKNFLLCYIAGSILLIISNRLNGLDFAAILNILIVLIAAFLFIKLEK